MLKRSAPARVVFVSSMMHSMYARLDVDDLVHDKLVPYDHLVAYSNTKLCNILTSNHLAKILRGTGTLHGCSSTLGAANAATATWFAAGISAGDRTRSTHLPGNCPCSGAAVAPPVGRGPVRERCCRICSACAMMCCGCGREHSATRGDWRSAAGPRQRCSCRGPPADQRIGNPTSTS